MNEMSCKDFLRWCLPPMGLRWEGFRRVRRQVCRRIRARAAELGLGGLAGYRERLEEDPDEWVALDGCCRVTISRFYRDRWVWEALCAGALPELAARTARDSEFRVWSAGCGAGEEPYTVAMIWRFVPALRNCGLSLSITATDGDGHQLVRARRAIFPRSSLRELPDAWCQEAFIPIGDEFELKPNLRLDVRFLRQDLREAMPDNRFHLILCRNLVFTYYDAETQIQSAHRLADHLLPGGFLVLGKNESLPPELACLQPLDECRVAYRLTR